MKKKYKLKFKNIFIFATILFVIIFFLVFFFNFKNWFLSETVKVVEFNLGDTVLASHSIDIVDGNVLLPFPSEIGIEAKAGEIFLGYDGDGDGVADYQAGEEVEVVRNRSIMSLSAVVQSDGIPFSAWLYDNNAYTTGTELTSDLNDVSTAWDHTNVARYLVIKPNFTEATGGTIEITLPVGMQLYGSNSYTGAGGNISSASFDILDDLDGTGKQGVGSYYNSKTGTLIYTFNELATNTDTLVIPVQYDINIWDKTTLVDTNFTDGLPPIKVVMTEGSNTYTKTLDDVVFKIKLNNNGVQVLRWYLPDQVLLDSPQSMSRDEMRLFTGYWENIEIEYMLPNKNGEYATYLGEVSPSSAIAAGTAVDIDTTDPSKVVYTLNKYHFKGSTYYFSPQLEFGSDVFNPGDILYFDVIVRVTSYGGKTLEYVVKGDTKISNGAELLIYGPGYNIYKDMNDSVEAHLGHISFRNAGLDSSGKVEMVYNFDILNNVGERNNIDVSAMSLPHPAKTTFNVLYTLVDKNNNVVVTDEEIEITSGNLNNSGGIITIPMVVNKYNSENPDNLLDVNEVNFKTIKYTIVSVPANTSLYTGAAALSNLMGGNFYGQYVSGSEIVESSLLVTEYNKDDTVRNTTLKRVTTRPTPTNSNSLYVRGASANDYSINAGENITFNVLLNVHSYPYGTSQYVETPVLYFLAPKGVWIDSETVVVKRGTETFEYEFEATEVGNAGQTLYSITVTDPEAGFGGSYFDSNGILRKAEELGGVTVTFDTNTDPSLDFTTETFGNMLFTRDLSGSVSIHSQYIVNEPFDFENDGKVDKVVKSLSGSVINIYANTNNFEFDNEISFNNGAFTTTNMSYILSDDVGDFSKGSANYRVNIMNDSDGFVAGEDFYHYIAVPKVGITYPDNMNVVNSTLDFSLNNEPIVYNENGEVYEFLYTTSTDLVDAEGNLKLTLNDFVPIEEISNINDVTMVRVTGIDNSILRAHTKDVVELNFIYEKVSLNDGYDSGKVISFNSYGWQKYLEGGVENTLNVYTLTNNVNAQIRYITNYEDNILVTYEETTEDEIIFTLPSYFEDKEMYILGINEFNLNLVNNSTILGNENSNDINITDNDFSVSALFGSVNYELANYNNSPIFLGTVGKDTVSEIKFTINGYNNIVDISSSKYIEVYLGDDVGIKYKLVINVDRKSPYLIDVSNAIVVGSYYKVIDSSSNTINITNNSSFTAQYSVLYDNMTYDLSLNLSVNYPVGTVIKMIDITDLTVDLNDDYNFTPNYYYYEVTASTNGILLTDFINNKSGSNYSLGESGVKKYIFVVDFIGGDLSSGSHTLGLNGSSFNINVEDKREFYITENNSEYILVDGKMDVNINISDSLITGVDSAYQNSIFGLKITFDGEIPPGTYIEMGEKIYLLEDSNVILNVDNYFLIPLGNIDDISDVEYTLHSRGEKIETVGIKHSLVNVFEPLGESFASVISNMEIHSKDRPAMRLEFVGNTQLIPVNSLSDITLKLNYIDYDLNTNFTAKLYILEKNNNVYLKQDDLIENVLFGGSSINPVQGTIVFNPVDLNTELELKLNLVDNNMILNKTYRIVVETNHLGETKYQEIINFIVVE